MSLVQGKHSTKKGKPLTKILVIPGNSSTGSILQKVLEKAGHDVVFEKPESPELSSSSSDSLPSLVITDFIAMNSDDSLNTLRHVHEVAPQAKIIALFSGSEDSQTKRQVVAEQPGVFQVVNDPFNVGELLEAMRTAIDLPHERLS